MSARAVQLCDAIVAKLNADPEEGETEFSQSFEARRLYSPFLEADEVKTLQVYVLANAKKAERTGRSGFTWTFRPVVVVQQEIQGETEEQRQAHVDALQQLVEEIEERLGNANFATEAGTFSFITFDEEQDRDVYMLELLRDANRFGAAITLEYLH